MNRFFKIALFPFAFCIVNSSFSFSQNLVPNPSFEQYTSCPDNLCQIHRTIGWSSYNASPDYFNFCGLWPWSQVSVPYNMFGFQNAADGNCYTGFYAYDSLNTPVCGLCREYIGTQLISPLVVGQRYYVRFKISLANISNYGVSKIGILFKMTSYEVDSATACTNTNTSLSAGNYAQVYSSAIISDTANWTTVSGSFITSSAFQYFSIGNHYDNLNSTPTLFHTDDNFSAAYYYLDDVYIGIDSMESVNDYDLQNKIIIYPNPFCISATIIFNDLNTNLSDASFSIYNLIGEKIKYKIINTKKF